jgi:hypothetical protein
MKRASVLEPRFLCRLSHLLNCCLHIHQPPAMALTLIIKPQEDTE